MESADWGIDREVAFALVVRESELGVARELIRPVLKRGNGIVGSLGGQIPEFADFQVVDLDAGEFLIGDRVGEVSPLLKSEDAIIYQVGAERVFHSIRIGEARGVSLDRLSRRDGVLAGERGRKDFF